MPGPLHLSHATDGLRAALSRAERPMAQWLILALGPRLGEATGATDAVWEDFQIDYLDLADAPSQTMLSASKTRQCGFSWLLAAEAVARAALYPASLTNIVSINRDEAEEKIRYARLINDCVDPAVRLTWVTDNREELEASNGSRIRSHACRPPRGRPGAHHRLDEIAHYQRPGEIYNAAVAGTLRAGSITCCSSPWVRGGFHYQVMEEPSSYPDFTRLWIPWWAVRGLCIDTEAARNIAPSLSTQDRVEQFGTDRLRRLFRNMPLDAFQVECELAYADDSLAWITWEEIQSCTGPADMDYTVCHGIDEAMRVLPGLLAKRAGRVFAGYDVARKEDKAVLTLCERVANTLVCFAVCVLGDVPFASQKAFLTEITPGIRSGCIDATGLGANLAEDMNRQSFRWHEITLSHPIKAQLAVDLRQQFQDATILIPPDRDLQRDLHSVQRIVTAANNMVYAADRDEELGHGDRFWALALAVHSVVRQFYSTGITQASLQPHSGGTASIRDTGGEEKPVTLRTAHDVNARLLQEYARQHLSVGDCDEKRAYLEALYPGLKRMRLRRSLESNPSETQ